MPMRIDEITDRVEHLDRRSHDVVWGQEVRLPLADIRWLFFQLELVAGQRDDTLLGCPCVHVEPCRSSCSCAHPALSGGCDRCCAYGSADQQRAAAERLAGLETERTAGGNIKGTVGHMLEISDQVGDRLSLDPERTGLLDQREAEAENQARESLMDDDFSRG